MNENEQRLAEAIENLDVDGAIVAAQAMLDSGAPNEDVGRILQEGFAAVERKFDSGDYFLGDFIVAGALYKEVLAMISESPEVLMDDCIGRIVYGVVHGDIHDIGKDIVVEVLRTGHFSVVDLGVDVPAAKFIEAIEEHRPDIVLLSGVMGISPLEMKDVVDQMNERGLHDTIPIFIGGACANEFVCKQIGSDAYGMKPTDTLNLCLEYMMSKDRGADGC